MVIRFPWEVRPSSECVTGVGRVSSGSPEGWGRGGVKTHLAGGGSASARGSRGSLPLVHLPGKMPGPPAPLPSLALSLPLGPIAAHAPFLNPSPAPRDRNPASWVPRVSVLLPPRRLGTAAPERGHWTCLARSTETTTPGRQSARARARCGTVGGSAGGAGKRRSVRGMSGNAGVAHARS